MIEINLLPEELRVKAEEKTKFKIILFLSSPLLIILVILNIYVILLTTAKNIQLTILNKKWQTLQPQRQTFDEFRRQHDVLSQDAKAIQQFINQRILWSNKINKLSLLLPSGVWFNEITLNKNDFVLKGSVISLKNEDMSLINLFLNNLKKEELFFGDFDNIDLISVQCRLLGGHEVTDFIFKGTLKTK